MDQAMEEWRDIKGFEGRYQVSNLGRVKSLRRVTQLNGRVRTEPELIMAVTYRAGYPTLILRKDGKRYSRQVHRLVAEAFLPNPKGLPIINHKDETRTNNCVENLEWCTQQHNIRWSAHKKRHPMDNPRPSSSGEKYIRKRKYKNGYSFSVEAANKNMYYFPCKSFKTMEEAMRYRDENLSKIFPKRETA